MPLGDEYDLSIADDVRDDMRAGYDDSVDATGMERVEAEALFLRDRYDRWPTIPIYQATPQNRYENARALTAELDYSPGAVYRFASAADLTRKMSGLFLAGAIDTLDAAHVQLPSIPEADYAFYENTGDVTVEGGVGDKAGYGMRSGTLTIEGDAGTHCGRFMEGGAITVEGDAGRALGHAMRDGRIHVHGDADDHAGLDQRDGTITVDGATGRAPRDSHHAADRSPD